MDTRLTFPFRKTHDAKVFVDDYSWCKSRVLAIDEQLAHGSNEEVINALIQSPFHLWQGEDVPSGSEWTWNGEKIHVEQFGPWDRTLMTSKDYAPVQHVQAQDLLRTHHQLHIEASEQELETVAQFFTDEVAVTYQLFHLILGPKDLDARRVVNNVFDHFIAFIGIDRAARRALIFEAGMD
jgi:hypothetical protein